MLLFDDESLKKRKAVWIALSDLFLDTDVSLAYGYIGRVCADSAFTLDELKEILMDEVAPVCSRNLLSVAGEWSGFEEEWLVSAIREGIKVRQGIFRKILKPISKNFFIARIEEDWKNLELIIVANRQGGE
jgi:hypothetical protein